MNIDKKLIDRNCIVKITILLSWDSNGLISWAMINRYVLVLSIATPEPLEI